MRRPIRICRKAPRKHQADHVAAIRAQRHAHADLAGAPLDGIRSHAIQSDGGQDQREYAEHAGHLRDGALLIELRINLVLQRSAPSAG